MATEKRKVYRDNLRNAYVEKIMQMLNEAGEEILQVKSNEFAFPAVDEMGNEEFIVVTVKVPTGANKGADPYDGYGEAESYKLKVKENEKKRAEKERKKTEKIARDEAARQKRAENAEKRKAE